VATPSAAPRLDLGARVAHGSVVEARGLVKIYRQYASPAARLAEALTRRARHRQFRALDDVTFSVARGAGFGVIGENGAGKSTLLKILAGVTAPTSGSVRVEGTVASILELGAGFHPDFSGRQNIRLNAALFGLGPREVEEKSPEIIAFSELGEFIDQPVKTYSTGMTMRLAFAIATQLDPAILIVDEALAVGDGYFQKKCMDRLLAFRRGGGTLLLCSHALYYVAAYCDTAVWLRDGKVAALGPTENVVRDYERHLAARSIAAGAGPQVPEADMAGPARITHVAVAPRGVAATGAPLEVQVVWETDRPERAFHVGIGMNRADEVEVASFSSHGDGLPPFSGRTAHQVTLTIPVLPLIKGEFTLYVFLLDEHGLHVYDRRILPSIFELRSEKYRFGIVDIPHQWHLPNAE
jgi:lipopolysaccharide transport system ATP-binding protein